MWLVEGLNRAVTTDGGVTARIICRRGAMLVAALALPGCSIVQDWEKPGATKEELLRVEDACEERANKRWPPAMVTRQRPSSYTSCDRRGRRCTTNYTTVSYSVDLNETRRSLHAEACIGDNGWTPIPGAARIRWMKFIRQLLDQRSGDAPP
jgi:hypothetical protein